MLLDKVLVQIANMNKLNLPAKLMKSKEEFASFLQHMEQQIQSSQTPTPHYPRQPPVLVQFRFLLPHRYRCNVRKAESIIE